MGTLKDILSLEVLVSCMHEPDEAIVRRSQINSDVLLINQCDCKNTLEYQVGNQCIRRIDTRQRGLSRSRNMAIEHAQNDLCLLCDDDEIFEPDYETTIINAFQQLKNADIMVFLLANQPCSLKRSIHKLNYLECLRVCSCQIAFRRKSVLESGVRFSPLIGAGSGNGCGEENKFLLDCYKKGLRIYHFPQTIASLRQEGSTWFQGFNDAFFYQRGIVTRYMLGLPLSAVYAFYYAFAKRNLYKQQISIHCALKEMLCGIRNNDIGKEEIRTGKLWTK